VLLLLSVYAVAQDPSTTNSIGSGIGVIRASLPRTTFHTTNLPKQFDPANGKTSLRR
jgi:hypothetical protein